MFNSVNILDVKLNWPSGPVAWLTTRKSLSQLFCSESIYTIGLGMLAALGVLRRCKWATETWCYINDDDWWSSGWEKGNWDRMGGWKMREAGREKVKEGKEAWTMYFVPWAPNLDIHGKQIWGCSRHLQGSKCWFWPCNGTAGLVCFILGFCLLEMLSVFNRLDSGLLGWEQIALLLNYELCWQL